MFKRIRNSFKEAFEVAKASHEVKNRLMWFFTPLTLEEYTFVLDSQMVRAFGSRVATAVYLEDGREMIVVDQDFMKLSHTAQLAILAHEQGHLSYGHKAENTKRVMTAIWSKGVHKHEIEADLYAVQRVGKDDMITALEELYSMYPDIEIERRIQIIQSY